MPLDVAGLFAEVVRDPRFAEAVRPIVKEAVQAALSLADGPGVD